MANRFWVGGTGTWDTTDTANWSATSGGAGGASVPTNADAAIFNANSGGGTVTIDAVSVDCLTLNVSAFTGTFAFGTNKIVIVGNAATVFTGGVGYSVTGTPRIEFSYTGSTGTRTITSGLPIEANVFDFYFLGGTDTIAIGTSSGTYGTQDYTGFAGTRGSGQSIIYRDLIISSGMTLPSAGTQFVFSGTSGIQKLTTNNKVFDFTVLKNAASTLQLQDSLTIAASRLFTLTAGALDLNNNTLTCSTFSSSNNNTRSIAFNAGKIIITGNAATIFSMAIADNFTYAGTPTIECSYSGSTGTRTIQFGSTSGATESNVPNISITAGTDIIGMASLWKNVNFTGFSGTLNNNRRTVYGDFTLPTGLTLAAGTFVTNFVGTSGVQQITTNGNTLDFPLTFNGIGGTFAFQDALTQGSTRAFTITNGTVELKDGATSTVGVFATSGTNQKFLESTLAGSQATLSQASGTVNATNLTIKDINATGGAEWNAFTTSGNVDAGNNDGWDFSTQIGRYIYTRRKNKRILP